MLIAMMPLTTYISVWQLIFSSLLAGTHGCWLFRGNRYRWNWRRNFCKWL